MTKSDSFQLGDIVIQVVRSARRKTLSIEVGHHGVKARAPMRIRHSAIVEFVTAKQQWIEQHLSALPAIKPELKLENGAELLLAGSSFNLFVVHGSSKPVYLSANSIVVPVKQSHLALEKTLNSKLTRWYKSVAYEELEEKVSFFSRLMDIPHSKSLSINVRDYKRRWGSCDSNGGLSFNWRIVQAPIEVLDYVVIHELAHCHEFNHSKRFWKIVAEQMPDWKQRQQWLHIYGAELYRL